MSYPSEYLLDVASQIMEKNPNYLLCGSLALILAKKIPPRYCNDIDFILVARNKDKRKLNHEKLMEHLQLNLDESYGTQRFEGYTCYQTTGDKFTGLYYNLFVFDETPYMGDVLEVVNGFKCQKIKDILYYKKEFNRRKDREDLGIEGEFSADDIPF